MSTAAPTLISASEICDRLHSILQARAPIGYDLEGATKVGCQAFATSPRSAFCIVTDALGSDSPAIWRLVIQVLEDPSIPKWVWNAHHELAVLKLAHGITLRGWEDGMALWFERWPDLPKGLKYAASILTRIPFWAQGITFEDDDSAEATASASRGPDFFAYNCLAQDTLVVTKKGNIPIGRLVKTQKQVHVLSLNESTKKMEWKSIIKWHRQVDRTVSFLRITTSGSRSLKPIICTPDHKVLTANDGWLEAKELKIGDQLYVDEALWSPEHRGTLLGTFLGDSSIFQTSNPAKSYGACAQVTKSLPSLKASLFGGTVTTSQRTSTYVPYPKTYWSWYMPACRQLECLRQELCGPVTHRLLDELTVQGLALWFMDDGCKQKRRSKHGNQDSAIFCLQGFPETERQTIVEWFRQRYGNGCLTKHGNFVMGVGASERLCASIGEYVLPDYRYKLPMAAPEWNPANAEPFTSTTPMWDRIDSITPFVPPGTRRGYKVRYCLEIEDNHNFFTPSGLVKNCADAASTLELACHPQLTAALKNPVTASRYALRKRLIEALTWASLRGILYDRDAARDLRNELTPQLWEAQARVDELASVQLPATADELLAAAAQACCNKVKLRRFAGFGPAKVKKGKGGQPDAVIEQPVLTWESALSIANETGREPLERIRALICQRPVHKDAQEAQLDGDLVATSESDTKQVNQEVKSATAESDAQSALCSGLNRQVQDGERPSITSVQSLAGSLTAAQPLDVQAVPIADASQTVAAQEPSQTYEIPDPVHLGQCRNETTAPMSASAQLGTPSGTGADRERTDTGHCVQDLPEVCEVQAGAYSLLAARGLVSRVEERQTQPETASPDAASETKVIADAEQGSPSIAGSSPAPAATFNPATRGELASLLSLGVNVKSTPQVVALLDKFKLPKIFRKRAGEAESRTKDEEALLDLYLRTGHPITVALLAGIHLRTQLQECDRTPSKDGRMRSSFLSCGTTTDRTTSKTWLDGTGGKLHVVPPKFRRCFRADPGMDWGKLDLTGADAWTVAARCATLGDPTMLDDLQAGLRIPSLLGLALEGKPINQMSRDDLKAACKALKRDWRDIAFKRCVYGSAYGMSPRGIRRVVVMDSYGELGEPRDPGLAFCARLQRIFLSRYWGIALWHQDVERQLKQTGGVQAASGLFREFFGRRLNMGRVDETTLREAYAFEPQSNTTTLINLGLDALWTDPENRYLDGERAGEPIVEPLLTVHDELATQWPSDRRDWALAKMRSWVSRDFKIGSVTVRVPFVLKWGPSWGEATNS